MRRLLIGSFVFGALLVLGGMSCQGNSPGPSPVGTTGSAPGGTTQLAQADLKLNQVPYESGVLIMAGTPYNVNLEAKEGEKGAFTFVIKLDKEGTVIEEERYRLEGNIFQYLGNSSETLEPPITLINFTQRIPSAETWNGTLEWGGTKFPAEADITVEKDPLNLQSGQVEDAVLVQVDLTITERPGNTAKREFKFWVAPNRGVLKRDFAAVSSREPAGNTPAE